MFLVPFRHGVFNHFRVRSRSSICKRETALCEEVKRPPFLCALCSSSSDVSDAVLVSDSVSSIPFSFLFVLFFFLFFFDGLNPSRPNNEEVVDLVDFVDVVDISDCSDRVLSGLSLVTRPAEDARNLVPNSSVLVLARGEAKVSFRRLGEAVVGCVVVWWPLLVALKLFRML